MPLQEMPEDAERQRRMQAPNRARPWSRSQAERALAMSGPRFEQTVMEFQVRFLRYGGGWGAGSLLLDEGEGSQEGG